MIGEIQAPSASERFSTTASVVPPDLAIRVMLKVLAFDRSLEPKVREGIRLAVVFDPNEVASRACADEFTRTFDAQTASYREHQPAAKAVSGAELVTAIRDGMNVAWFCDGTGSAHSAEGIRDSALVTFTSDEAAVRRGEIALGIVARDGKPKLLLNAAAAKRAGIDLDFAVVRMMEVVGAEPAAAVAMP